MGRSLRGVGGGLVALALWASGAPATAAKGPPSRVITRPDWAQKPSGEDMQRFYPERAQAESVSGRATIGCRVTAEGLLTACTVKREAPRGQGFGQAAIALSSIFRMKPKTVDGTPVDGGAITIPIVFGIPEAEAMGDSAIVLTRRDPAQAAAPIAASAGLALSCPDEAGECLGHYLDWRVRPTARQTAALVALAGQAEMTGARCLIATDGLLEACAFGGDPSPGALAAMTQAVTLFKAPPTTRDGVSTALAEVLILFDWPELAKARGKGGRSAR